MYKTIVVYSSKYGYTKRYAQWISQKLSCSMFDTSSIKASALKEYDTIIFGGGMYAGKLRGMNFLLGAFEGIKDKNVIVFTCGIADPTIKKNEDKIKGDITRCFTPYMAEKIKLFHLRGGMDYSKLTPIHKAMMKMLYTSLKKKSPEDMSEEDKGIIESYGKAIDFSDKNSIAPIIQYVKTLNSQAK